MASNTILSLFLVVVVSTVMLGGATVLATASSAQFGFRQSLPLLVGVALGLVLLAAAAGLGGISVAASWMQTAMKLAGSTYLLLLAWTIVYSRPTSMRAGVGIPTSFLGGAGFLLINSKGWAALVRRCSVEEPTPLTAPTVDLNVWLA